MCALVLTHTRSRMHTQTHVSVCMFAHVYTLRRTGACTYAGSHPHAHALTRACMLSPRTHTHAHARAHTCTQALTCGYTLSHVYIDMHVHSCSHAHMQTRIHSDTHSSPPYSPLRSEPRSCLFSPVNPLLQPQMEGVDTIPVTPLRHVAALEPGFMTEL